MAKPHVYYLKKTGIIQGNRNAIHPKNLITRAEFATMLLNVDKYKETSGQATGQKNTQPAQKKPDREPDRIKNRDNRQNEAIKMRRDALRKKALQLEILRQKSLQKEDPLVPPYMPERPDKPTTPERPSVPDTPTPRRDPLPNKPRRNPKGYEVIRLREPDTPTPGPAIPPHGTVQRALHNDGRAYYGIRLRSVDAYVIQEVNATRLNHGLNPLKVVTNWDDKIYLRATESNMAMQDYNQSEWWERDMQNDTPFKNSHKFNTKHRRADGSNIDSLFAPLYVPREYRDRDVRSVSENLAWHYSSDATDAKSFAKDIVEVYMNSPGHRANILDPSIHFINSGTTLQTRPDGTPVVDENSSKTDICNAIVFS